MIEQRYADLFANSSQVPLEVAEREIVLTYVLKILADADLLKTLAFKGGTCLRKCVYGKETRFSMDLDFTHVGAMKPDDLILAVVEALSAPTYDIAFSVRTEDFYVAEDKNSCGAVVKYRHSWHSGHFKLEISLRESPSLPLESLPLKPQSYMKHLEFSSFPVRCLAFPELLAEKIRAASQRVRTRDLYDLAKSARRPFDPVLIRRLVVIKCWNVRDPFDPQRFFKKIDSGKYDWDDLRQLVRRSERIEPAKLIGECKRRFTFLLDLSEDETTLASDAKRHKFKNLPRTLLEG